MENFQARFLLPPSSTTYDQQHCNRKWRQKASASLSLDIAQHEDGTRVQKENIYLMVFQGDFEGIRTLLHEDNIMTWFASRIMDVLLWVPHGLQISSETYFWVESYNPPFSSTSNVEKMSKFFKRKIYRTDLKFDLQTFSSLQKFPARNTSLQFSKHSRHCSQKHIQARQSSKRIQWKPSTINLNRKNSLPYSCQSGRNTSKNWLQRTWIIYDGVG